MYYKAGTTIWLYRKLFAEREELTSSKVTIQFMVVGGDEEAGVRSTCEAKFADKEEVINLSIKRLLESGIVVCLKLLAEIK